jgi:DNA helicase-2/ATP-dependent DNA helicase PcrA
MIAYLRVLENPKDVVSWNRILLLLDGVGPRTAERVTDDILQRKVAPSSPEFWKEFHAYPQNVRDLFEVLKDIAPGRTPPGDKVSRLITYYHPLFKNRYDDHTKRKKDLEAFEQIAARYDDISGLLADLALEPPVESVADVASTGKDEERLTLSTIHSAKGLEWNTVFLITALDGRFPAMRAVDDLDELEEERRLMYVAVTRAKEHLFITYPINMYDRETGLILSKPSRFLEGLGEQLLEPWIVGEE